MLFLNMFPNPNQKAGKEDSDDEVHDLNIVLRSRMELFKELGMDDSEETQTNQSLSTKKSIHVLSCDILKVPDSPIHWWKSNQTKFPRLKQLFDAFLSASPTSASSEVTFSKAGKFMAPQRSNLDPFKLNMICFVNANLKLMEENGDVFLTSKFNFVLLILLK